MPSSERFMFLRNTELALNRIHRITVAFLNHETTFNQFCFSVDVEACTTNKDNRDKLRLIREIKSKVTYRYLFNHKEAKWSDPRWIVYKQLILYRSTRRFVTMSLNSRTSASLWNILHTNLIPFWPRSTASLNHHSPPSNLNLPFAKSNRKTDGFIDFQLGSARFSITISQDGRKERKIVRFWFNVVGCS